VSALEDEGLPLGVGGEQVLRGDGFAIRVCVRDGDADPVPARVPSRVGTDAADLEAERARWAERERACARAERGVGVRQPSAPERWTAVAGDEPPSTRRDATGIACAAAGDEDDRDLDEADDLDPGGHPVRTSDACRSLGARCHDVLATMDLGHPERVVLDDVVGGILVPFFHSEAFREIQRADRVERELPFVVALGDAVWSGRIDVVYRDGDRWIVADYKSDRAERPERYATQARVYAEAARRALGLAAAPEFRLIYLRSGRSVSV